VIFATALGIFAPNSSTKTFHRGQGVGLVLAASDLSEGLLRGRVRRFRQRGKHIRRLVEPAALLGGVGEHLAQRAREPKRAVTDGEHQGAHAAAFRIAEQVGPRLGRLPVAISERDQLLAAVARTPMSTNKYSLFSSRRMLTWMPSAQT
jgi:hypothetical protein